MKVKKNVIFLDIDGVINSLRAQLALGGMPRSPRPETWKYLDPVACKLVAAMAEKLDASVVLSSSWRILMKDYNAFYQATDIMIADATGSSRDNRGEEISLWLKEHPEVKNYVIFDDDGRAEDGHHGHFVHTDPREGITFLDIQLAFRLMGSNVHSLYNRVE